MVTIFVLKKINCSGNYYFILNRPSHLSLLNGKNNGFTTEKKMIDKEDTFSFI